MKCLGLGQLYDWYTDSNGKVSVHISKQAMIENLREKNKYHYCKGCFTPYCSGLKIDCIKCNDIAPEEKVDFVQNFQHIIWGLDWLSINMSPDISTAYNLLSQFNSNPSPGHTEAAH